MVFGGPQILDCYLHTAKPTKLYTPATCKDQKEKTEEKKKRVPVKKTAPRPVTKSKKAKKDPLPIAQPNLKKKKEKK